VALPVPGHRLGQPRDPDACRLDDKGSGSDARKGIETGSTKGLVPAWPEAVRAVK